MRELEDALGVCLIERDGRGIRLTREGEIFLQHASGALSALQSGIHSVVGERFDTTPPIRIGALPTVSSRIMPLAMELFLQDENAGRVEIATGDNDRLLEQLRLGELDLVVGRLAAPHKMTGLTFEHLYSEMVAFVVRPGHPLLEDACFNLSSLLSYPILMPARKSIIRQPVDQFLIAHGMEGLKSRIATVSDSFGRTFVRRTDAVWIISEGVVDAEIREGRLAKLPVDTVETQGPVGLTTVAETAGPARLPALMQMIRRAVQSSLGMDILKSLFDEAVRAADPFNGIRRYLPEPPREGRTFVIGAGKGAAQMAAALETLWDGPLTGLVVTRYGYGCATKHIEILEAAHPVPDENGLVAGRRLLDAVAALSADDLVIALICGGGSALLPSPPPGLTLQDEIALNETLLSSGAPISGMNVVRKHFSTIKGGRLAAATKARIVSLIVSDIPGDDPAFVASGPTVPDVRGRQEALAAIEQYRLALPQHLYAHLNSALADAPKPADAVFSRNEVHIIASAGLSLEAAATLARSHGIDAHILSDSIEGEARHVAGVHGALAREIFHKNRPFSKPAILLSGGETTVTLRGRPGKGGRNSEFALALALSLGDCRFNALAADTDGIDGSEDNAGAFVDGTTVARLRAAGLDGRTLLDRNDSYSGFSAIGDLFETGPTGTNVNDFRAIIIRAGIDNIIVERASRAHVLGRVRAGVLEQGTVDLLDQAGVGQRLHKEGLRHGGVCVAFGGRSHRIDLASLTGQSVTVYGQTEVTQDLMSGRDASGQSIIYEAEDVAIRDVDRDSPYVTYRTGGMERRIDADFIAGCDGFHGASRRSIPPDRLHTFERTYPFGWLGILADVPPANEELIYASHPRGFALCSMRSRTRSRYYIQCGSDEKIADWSDERFYDELRRRLPQEHADRVTRGASFEKSIAPLRSFVAEPMRYGRLFLVGDAAHIVPPTGAKGLNLAASDVHYLFEALNLHYCEATDEGINSYSDRALKRIWGAVRFSWSMTMMMHSFPGEEEFAVKIKQAELDYLVSSAPASKAFAENYVGLPF
eukprot:g3874.t1